MKPSSSQEVKVANALFRYNDRVRQWLGEYARNEVI